MCKANEKSMKKQATHHNVHPKDESDYNEEGVPQKFDSKLISKAVIGF